MVNKYSGGGYDNVVGIILIKWSLVNDVINDLN